MPRNRNVYQNFADVSVKSFADAKISSKKLRISKNANNSLGIESDFEALDITYPETDTKKSKKSPSSDALHEYATVYPNEVWFLISEHIAAEDVGRFALICRQTYHITTTMKFWRHLYLRYYDANVELPVRLQKDCMTRPGGIRACTIRSLFYTYPLLVDRLHPNYYQNTDGLLNRQLMNYWYRQIGHTKVQFFFKFKRRLVDGSRAYQSDQLQRQDHKSLASLRDVYANSEEGCSLLIVESNKLQGLHRLEVLGNESYVSLASIALRLSADCAHFRCALTFGSISKSIITSVCIEPANGVKVYDWWVPSYTKYVHSNDSSKKLQREHGNSGEHIDDPWYNWDE